MATRLRAAVPQQLDIDELGKWADKFANGLGIALLTEDEMTRIRRHFLEALNQLQGGRIPYFVRPPSPASRQHPPEPPPREALRSGEHILHATARAALSGEPLAEDLRDIDPNVRLKSGKVAVRSTPKEPTITSRVIKGATLDVLVGGEKVDRVGPVDLEVATQLADAALMIRRKRLSCSGAKESTP